MLHRTSGRLPDVGHQRRLGKRRPQVAPRPDADILVDIKELAPAPRDEPERWHKLLVRCVEKMRVSKRLDDVKAPSPAARKEKQRGHFKRLQVARYALVATGAPKELVEMYDRHLRDVETDLGRAVRDPKTGRYHTVPPGMHSLNWVGCCATVMARDLILASRQPLSWSRWNRLSTLLFEAATGEDEKNLSRYVTACKRGEIGGGHFRW